MIKTDYEIGDTVWFYGTNHKGKKTSAIVVGKVKHPIFDFTIFVAEISTEVGPFFITGNAEEFSPSKDEPIGMYQGI